MDAPVFPIFSMRAKNGVVVAAGGGGEKAFGVANGVVVIDGKTEQKLAYYETNDVIVDVCVYDPNDVVSDLEEDEMLWNEYEDLPAGTAGRVQWSQATGDRDLEIQDGCSRDGDSKEQYGGVRYRRFGDEQLEDEDIDDKWVGDDDLDEQDIKVQEVNEEELRDDDLGIAVNEGEEERNARMKKKDDGSEEGDLDSGVNWMRKAMVEVIDKDEEEDQHSNSSTLVSETSSSENRLNMSSTSIHSSSPNRSDIQMDSLESSMALDSLKRRVLYISCVGERFFYLLKYEAPDTDPYTCAHTHSSTSESSPQASCPPKERSVATSNQNQRELDSCDRCKVQTGQKIALVKKIEKKISFQEFKRDLYVVCDEVLYGFYDIMKTPNTLDDLMKTGRRRKKAGCTLLEDESHEEYAYRLSRRGERIVFKREDERTDIVNNWKSFFIADGMIHKVLEECGKNVFVYNSRKYCYNEEIGKIACSEGLLVYYLKGRNSVLYFQNDVERIFNIRKITTMSFDEGRIVVGTGDGCVYMFEGPVMKTRKIVSDVPVTGVGFTDGNIYFSVLIGIVGKIGLQKKTGSMFYIWMLLVLLLAVVVGIYISRK